jgi:amino acid transporter
VRGRAILFFAFAFAVIADPVSSVAYAIEAALRALDGRLDLLVPTMALVIGIIAVVTVNYWRLVGRFPAGGGDPEAVGRAFGTAFAFPAIGALVVDFALTIAISIAAATSAIIAFVPAVAPVRMVIALVLLAVVAALTWFGHGGRLVFALMTGLFVLVAVAVLVRGFVDPSRSAPLVKSGSEGDGRALLLVVLAFPVAMALATGVEAASTAIAQLGQLDDRGRRRFGRGTLLLIVGIVGGLTIALAALAVRLDVGLPSGDSTQIADLAQAAAGDGALFGLFQLSSTLLLLAAASSSFQAGPGLLKALTRDPSGSGRAGILPAALGRTNRHHTPYLAVLAYFGIAALIILAAAAREQELVLFYAVAVFVGFLSGLLAMARFASDEGDRAIVALNSLAILAVTFTVVVNVARGYPLVSLAAMGLIAGLLYRQWRRAGRPGGTAAVERASPIA